MKKIFFLLFAGSALLAGNIHAQGFYFTVSAGYGLGLSSQDMNTVNETGVIYPIWSFDNLTYSPPYYQSYDGHRVYVSLGKGAQFGSSFGYMFDKYVGAEIGVSYLSGAKTTAISNMSYVGGTDTYITASSLYSNTLRLSPSLILTAGKDKINPYIKFGFLFSAGSIHIKSNTSTTTGTYTTELEQKLNGGIATGITASLGVLYKLNKRLALFFELKTDNLSYAPTKGELTKDIYNGVDQLPNASVSDKKTIYVDHYSFGSSNPQLSTEPQKALKVKYPYGNIGANIGLKVSF